MKKRDYHSKEPKRK